ncbi:chloride channel protein [Candidatus Hecatella orcuttiae]|jgi:CIC family chloride channel protein|uniref:chloride channel protein n=1 Tax=Candidatus Hecatella orcuttiae TaxID=1935119 RepID=UPI0028681BB6|nr:chloride channel protein [Candidatus Hecatella orcuttiae]
MIGRLRERFHIPAHVERLGVLDVLGIVAGLAGGLGAVFFRYMIGFTHWAFFDLLLPLISFRVNGFNLGIILLPAIGGLIVGPIVFTFASETKGHGVPEVMEAIHLRGGRIRKRVAAVKIIASSITIGSGGSAGREGPIAQIGAALGSFLGHFFHLKESDVKLLVICGLSAGIAGTFNAPLGGALFGMEVLYREFRPLDAVPIILASVVGAAVASIFFGLNPAFQIPPLPFTNPAELFFYFLLGLFFGLMAVLWVKIFYAVEDLFNSLKLQPRLKLAVGGLLTGGIGMLFPTYGIMGVGYEGIDLALVGTFPLVLLLVLGFLKLFATSFTIGSGGSGGIFAPSLFIGAMLGGFLGLVFHGISPEIIQYPYAFSLAGMGALFAGAARAPLTCMIMIPEMTNDWSLLPPLMLSTVTSFLISSFLLRGSSIYTLKLERRGVRLRERRRIDTLDLIKVGEVMETKLVTVPPDITVSQFMEVLRKHRHMGYPVVDKGRLIGMMTFDDVLKIPRDMRDKVTVLQAANQKLAVTYPDETVHRALDKMYERGVDRLAVVDREHPEKLLGIITDRDVIHAHHIVTERSSELE